MNKKIPVILILAAMLAGSIASCGKTGGNDSKAETKTTAETETTAEEDETAPEETEAVTEEPEEPTPEEDTVESETDESSEPDEEDDDESEAEHQETQRNVWLKNIEDYQFANGSKFTELEEKGMVNAYAEGKAYAIVPNAGGGAAGSIYYDVFNSTDGGKAWLPCENFRVSNGNNTFCSLQDGCMVLFSQANAEDKTYPSASYLYFDGIGLKSVDLEDKLSSLVIDEEGTLWKDADFPIEYEIEYVDDYKFRITITDLNWYEVIFEDTVDYSEAVTTAMDNLYS